MAKCVRVVGQGVPMRLCDHDAFVLVERDKDGEYCSKKFYKEWYADEPRANRAAVGCKGL